MAITYTDKVQNAVNPLPVTEQWRAVDANEVKTEFNAHQANASNPHNVTSSQVGLGNVDNTSDANKPVSTAQQTALNLKANLDSPTFTGTPNLPTGSIGITQSFGNNTAALATTAFVQAALGTWTTWGGSLASTGFSAISQTVAFYIDNGKTVTIWIEVTGTSNATTFTLTLPIAPNASYSASGVIFPCFTSNNGVAGLGRIYVGGGSTTATVEPTISGGAWTASGSKSLKVTMTYQK